MLVFVAMLFILVCKGTCQFQSISDCHSIDYPVSSFEIHCRVDVLNIWVSGFQFRNLLPRHIFMYWDSWVGGFLSPAVFVASSHASLPKP